MIVFQKVYDRACLLKPLIFSWLGGAHGRACESHDHACLHGAARVNHVIHAR